MTLTSPVVGSGSDVAVFDASTRTPVPAFSSVSVSGPRTFGVGRSYPGGAKVSSQ